MKKGKAKLLLFFLIFSIIAIVSAFYVVYSKNVVHSMLFLIVAILNSACLFVLLDAEFIAAVQILVYGGAMMVLFVFAIMLVNLRDIEAPVRYHAQTKVAVGVGCLLFVESLFFMLPGARNVMKIGDLGAEIMALPGVKGNTQLVGKYLFSEYILPFEIVSIVLLVAVVGAVILGRHWSSR